MAETALNAAHEQPIAAMGRTTSFEELLRVELSRQGAAGVDPSLVVPSVSKGPSRTESVMGSRNNAKPIKKPLGRSKQGDGPDAKGKAVTAEKKVELKLERAERMDTMGEASPRREDSAPHVTIIAPQAGSEGGKASSSGPAVPATSALKPAPVFDDDEVWEDSPRGKLPTRQSSYPSLASMRAQPNAAVSSASSNDAQQGHERHMSNGAEASATAEEEFHDEADDFGNLEEDEEPTSRQAQRHIWSDDDEDDEDHGQQPPAYAYERDGFASRQNLQLGDPHDHEHADPAAKWATINAEHQAFLSRHNPAADAVEFEDGSGTAVQQGGPQPTMAQSSLIKQYFGEKGPAPKPQTAPTASRRKAVAAPVRGQHTAADIIYSQPAERKTTGQQSQHRAARSIHAVKSASNQELPASEMFTSAEEPLPRMEEGGWVAAATAAQSQLPNFPQATPDVQRYIRALQNEIQQFQVETQRLKKLRTDQERELDMLRKDNANQKKKLGQREQAFHAYMEDEMKKIRRERLALEKHARSVQNLPTRKDRDELQSLRTENGELQKEMQAKEAKWKAERTRMQRQVKTLTEENENLKQEVQDAEQRRLSDWEDREKRYKLETAAQLEKVRIHYQQQLRTAQGAARSVEEAGNEHEDSSQQFYRATASQGVASRAPVSTASNGSSKSGGGGSVVPAPPRPGVSVPSQQAIPRPALTQQQQQQQQPPQLQPQQQAQKQSKQLTRQANSGAGHVRAGSQTLTVPASTASPQRQASTASPQRQGVTAGLTVTPTREGAQSPQAARKVIRSPPPTRGYSSRVPAEAVLSPTNKAMLDSAVAQSRAAAAQGKASPRTDIAAGSDNPLLVDEREHDDGKIEQVYNDGSRLLTFPNQTRKHMCADGRVEVEFPNGDTKKTFPDGRVVYFYASARTTHTTFPTGLQIYDFLDQQVEKHFPDGTKEIVYADGTVKYVEASGDEQSIFPNGTIQRMVGGVRSIIYPS